MLLLMALACEPAFEEDEYDAAKEAGCGKGTADGASAAETDRSSCTGDHAEPGISPSDEYCSTDAAAKSIDNTVNSCTSGFSAGYVECYRVAYDEVYGEGCDSGA